MYYAANFLQNVLILIVSSLEFAICIFLDLVLNVGSTLRDRARLDSRHPLIHILELILFSHLCRGFIKGSKDRMKKKVLRSGYIQSCENSCIELCRSIFKWHVGIHTFSWGNCCIPTLQNVCWNISCIVCWFIALRVCCVCYSQMHYYCSSDQEPVVTLWQRYWAK